MRFSWKINSQASEHPLDWPGLSPIAVNTCDGSSEPVVQAEPLEAQTPNSSSNIRMASASTPSKQRLAVFGSRIFAEPTRNTLGISRSNAEMNDRKLLFDARAIRMGRCLLNLPTTCHDCRALAGKQNSLLKLMRCHWGI